MQKILLLAAGLIPAVLLRYVILRRPLEKGPAIGVCCAGLLLITIVLTTIVQKRHANTNPEENLGPIPILADWAGLMGTVALPVLIASYFILRAGARSQT